MYIRQQGGFALNTADGKLYKEIWRESKETEGLSEWSGEYEPHPFGLLAFRVVEKLWWFGFRNPFDTQPYYPAWMYPTRETTDYVAAVLRHAFPTIAFSYRYGSSQPQDYATATATSRATGESMQFSPGAKAIEIMDRGEKAVIRDFGSVLASAGLL